MKRLSIGLALFWAFVSCPSVSTGQDDPGIFSGRGIASSQDQAPPTKSPKIRWPKLLNLSSDQDRPRKERSFKNLFSRKPNFDFRKNKNDSEPDEGLDRRRGFSGFSELFPKRNPNRPNMLEQLNTKSKSLFSKTTDWAQHANEDLRSKTYDTWDAITRDMHRSDENPKDEPILKRPPVRSGDSLLRKPKFRF